MRVAPLIALIVLALSSAAPATTVITGTLPADPGGTVDTGQLSIPGLASGQFRDFQFEWSGGALLVASLTHQVEFGYLYYDTFMDPPMLTGNEITLIGDCDFFPGVASCNGPLVNGAIAGNRISGRIITLPGFDICATENPVVGDSIHDCAQRYDTAYAFFGAAFDPDSSISYRLIIGDAAVVPEPATWALMVGGFALAGGMLRRPRGGGPQTA